MAWCGGGLAWHGVVWVWCGVGVGVAWRGMAWHGVAWCGVGVVWRGELGCDEL